jgi:hypothetical protein
MVFSSLIDASVIVAVFSAMILYFGKIISDIDVEYHDKLDFSVIGAIYTSVWVIVPLGAVYSVYQKYFTSIQQSLFWGYIPK